jgi:hypothetical protein
MHSQQNGAAAAAASDKSAPLDKLVECLCQSLINHENTLSFA